MLNAIQRIITLKNSFRNVKGLLKNPKTAKESPNLRSDKRGKTIVIKKETYKENTKICKGPSGRGFLKDGLRSSRYCKVIVTG